MKFLLCNSIYLYISLFVTASVQAQDPGLMMLYGDHDTVSVSTGTAKPLHLAPSVASVITAEDIRATGATTLDEALEAVPGLHVSSSFNRLNPNYSIRGIHTGQTPQVLLLLNGVPIRQLFSGSRPNSLRMPVSNIARIEVIRGPGSAIYGADAFAGVINIITKLPESNNNEVGLRGSSFDRAGGWLSNTVQFGDWNMSLNIEADQSDGDRGRVVKSDLQSTFDTGFGTSASNAPGALDSRYDILTTSLTLQNQNWRFNLWQYQNEDAGVGPGAAQILDPSGRQDTHLYLFDAIYRSDATDHWRWEAQANYLYGKSQPYFTIFPSGSRLPIGSDGNVNLGSANQVDFPDGLFGNPHTRDEQSGFELRSFYQGWSNHQWRVAVGAQGQKLTASSTQNFGPGVIDGTTSPIDGSLTDVTGTDKIFIPDSKRDITYVSVQDEWQLHDDWALTYGVRADDYSDFGETINPRLALVWAMDYDLTSKLLYGQAFRAPSFNELYAVNNPSILGNPKLKPERINTLELVFAYHPANDNRLSLSLFRYDIEDLIQYVKDSSGTSKTAQNTGGIDGYGLEVEGRWHVSKIVLLRANYAWQASEDKATGQAVADAPQQQLYLDARWQFIPQWHLGLEGYRVFDRKRVSGDTRAGIADYTWVNLTLRHQRSNSGWSFTGGLRNLTDADAREPSDGRIADDYLLEGQSIYLETRYQWPR